MSTSTPVRLASTDIDPLTSEQVVDRVLSSLAAGRGGLLITPNVDVLRLLQRPAHAGIASAASLAVCDGMPVLWASRLAGTPLPGRVTGSSLIWTLSEAAAVAGRSVCVVGGAPGVAEDAGRALAARTPALVVRDPVCPPLGFEREAASLAAVVAEVIATRADVVYVCLGFPKQERLAIALMEAMPATWFVACGAAADFVAGTQRRAPALLQGIGLEWAHRIACEPRRLTRRYVADVPFALTLLARSAAHGLVRRLSTGETRRLDPARARAASRQR